MANLTQFSVVRSGTASLTVPVWTITGQLAADQTGTVLADFTGPNSLLFPQVLGQLTNNQQDEIVNMVVRQILLHKFGV